MLSAKYDVLEAGGRPAAVAACHRCQASLVVVSVASTGFDLTRFLNELHRHPATASVPVVAIAGALPPNALRVLLRAGASDAVFEPYTDAELAARVDAQLDLARERRAGGAPTARAPAARRVLGQLTGAGFREDGLGSAPLVASLLDTMPIGVAFLGPRLRFMRANAAFAAHAGLEGPAMGKHYATVLARPLSQAFTAALGRVFEGEARSPVTDVVVGVTRRNGERTLVASFYPVRPMRQLLGIGVTLEDVTERQRLLAEVQTSRRVLARKSAFDEAFIATMSHELRTPLAAINLWTELLAGRERDAAARERAVDGVRKNAAALGRIIGDLLDASRAETGKLSLVIGPCDLAQTAREVCADLAGAAEASGVVLAVDAPPSLPAVCDEQRIGQALRNLVSNALEHARARHVTVSVREQNAGHVLAVEDDGIGIRRDELHRIFEPFYQPNQGDDPTPRTGLGLGLAITQHIAELHGGKLDAESAGHGQGATFCITLPAWPR